MRDLILALCCAVALNSCAATQTPSLIDELQTQGQIKDVEIPTQLTDLGILRYGEHILTAWGLRSQASNALNIGGQVTLAALSTGALASGAASPVVQNGLVAAFNGILQMLGVIKPAERNDARHEGAAMILAARGEFLNALAAKRIYRISNSRFTPQGALYFKQIGAALEIVDRLLVGQAPRLSSLEALKPVPIAEQPTPEPEPPAKPTPPSAPSAPALINP